MSAHTGNCSARIVVLGGTPFVDLLCFILSCVCYAMYVSVYMCLVVTCLERADLLALVCGVLP